MSIKYIINHSTWGARLSGMDDHRKAPKATCFRVRIVADRAVENHYSHPLSEPNGFFYFQLKGYRAFRKHPFAYLKACKVVTGPTGISCNRRKEATINRTIIISFERFPTSLHFSRLKRPILEKIKKRAKQPSQKAYE